MVKSRRCDKRELKKGVWTEEEDRKLLSYVKKHGQGGWRLLPHKAGLKRCGKSCRLRWVNYLRPGIRRGDFSPEEEQTIIRLHALLGNRWATISRHLYKRTDNEIKNHWNTHLKKHVADLTNITDEHRLAAEKSSTGPPKFAAKPDQRPDNFLESSTQKHGDENGDDPVDIDQVISDTETSAPSTYRSTSQVFIAQTPNLHCSDDNDTINMDLILPKASTSICANYSGNVSTNMSNFDKGHSRSRAPSSSVRMLNKIASKMGLFNIRHAGLDSTTGCRPADSSSTACVSRDQRGFQGNSDSRSPNVDYWLATSENAEAMLEVDDAEFFQQISMEF